MQTITGVRHYDVHEFSDLRDMLAQSVQRYPDLPAFRFRSTPQAEPETRTYRQFDQDIKALGSWLTTLPSVHNRIGIIGENSYAWSLAHAAVINGAGIVVPIDRLLPSSEVIDLIKRADVDILFYDPFVQPYLDQAVQEHPMLKTLICMHPDLLSRDENVPWQLPEATGDAPDGAAVRYHRLDDCLAYGRQLLDAGHRTWLDKKIDPDVMATLLFTSGTTSASKAVMLSHRNLAANIRALAGVVTLPAGIRMLSVLPLHHTFENTCGLYMALHVGAQIHVADGLRYIQKNLVEYQIEMIIGVPVLFNNFYAKVQAALEKTGKKKLVYRMIPVTQLLRKVGIDLRRRIYHQLLDAFGGHLRLGICGAAPIDPQVISFFDAIGIRILEGYGMTEASPVISGCNTKVFVPGTVGQPLAGVTLAIDTDEDGGIGEILTRSDCVMLGYYNNPEATAETIDADGWLHTGDMGRIDPKSGCLQITGRLKSMIVLKTGKKVFPEEIEHLIGQHEIIRESMVWGELDESGDVVVSAKFVIDRDKLEKEKGGTVDDQSIRQMLDQLIQDINAKMPSFRSIRHYVYSFQDMVKTTTLKIKRPIEIDRMKQLMQKQQLKWRELTGRNIDTLDDHSQAKEKDTDSGGRKDEPSRER